MAPGTEGERALLAQSAANVASLRGLGLRLREPLAAEIGAGDFGENLWFEGPELSASSLCVGDTFAALRGGAPSGLVLQVSSPRGPCYRMDARHGKTPGPD